MRRGYLKKAFAVVLSAAMAFSMSAAGGRATASAASSKYVRLNTAFKTLKVGQKDYRLKLTNNSAKWKITKVSTTDKKTVMVYGKTASYVLLKGKQAGRATVRVNLKTAMRKKNNVKALKCRVNVVAANPTPDVPIDPDTPDTPKVTSAKAATQAELTAALANKDITSIAIETDKAESFTIPAGVYSTVDLTVNAPNADVDNSGVFKSITINSIKEDTWRERAVGNALRVIASKAHIVVEQGARVAGIQCSTAGASVALEVNGTGKVEQLALNASLKVEISGTSKENIPVTVAQAAKGAELTSAIPVGISTVVDLAVKLQAGAEGSTIKATAQVAIKLDNKTTVAVKITSSTGTVLQNVSAGSNITANVNGSSTGNQSSGSSGGSSGVISGGSSGSSSGGSSGGSSTSSPVWYEPQTIRLSGNIAGLPQDAGNDLTCTLSVSGNEVKAENVDYNGTYMILDKDSVITRRSQTLTFADLSAAVKACYDVASATSKEMAVTIKGQEFSVQKISNTSASFSMTRTGLNKVSGKITQSGSTYTVEFD